MSELICRAYEAGLEVRSGGDGRTVHGLAVPYNRPTDIREWGQTYKEEFVLGSFARTIAERGNKVKFLEQHDSLKPLGRATALREDANGLYAEFRVSKTQRGDEMLEMIQDGTIDSFSIGFIPVTDDKRDAGKHVIRREVKLREVSAVTFPAYEGAAITGIRSLSEDDLRLANEGMEQLRAGKSVSGQQMAALKHVLSLVSMADTAVDQAQPILAQLLGVPNPDIAQDKAMDEEDGDRADEVLELISIRAWDAAANEKRIPDDAPASELHKMYAWCPEGSDIKKSDCKFPFHDVSADGKVGAPNLDACSAGIAALNGARGGTTIPDSDREKVYAKLAAPLKAAGKTPAPLRSDEGMSLDLAIRKAQRLGITRKAA